MTKISGGGIRSNKLVQSTKWKQEPKPKVVNPASVSTLGLAVQFPKPKLETGVGYQTKPVPPSGIPGKYNAATSGPGSLRTVHRSGSQSTYGPVNPGEPKPAPRDILRDYGPEATGKK
jgi:hypothetical protein